MKRWAVLGLVLACWRCGAAGWPALAIGTPAPAFSLPGADGTTHALADFASSPVLAVVFTCNHCPTAELYERRLNHLYDTYHDKGVAFVAINPDSENNVRLDEMGNTDVDDSLAGMKERVTTAKIQYPYLFDGADQAVARAFGASVTPEMFIFDRARRLRYRGRVDDAENEASATTHEAQDALDALLANKPVPVTETRAVGCPVRPLANAGDVTAERAQVAAASVTVQPIGASDLKQLRQNGTGQLMLVNFWATWCAPCVNEFPELQRTYLMYKSRGLRFVTVSANTPAETPAVVTFLHQHQATSTNRQFASDDIETLENAFDPRMPAALPFTLLIAPNGDVLHQETGEADVPALRRAILANLPDDPAHPGMRAHWTPD